MMLCALSGDFSRVLYGIRLQPLTRASKWDYMLKEALCTVVTRFVSGKLCHLLALDACYRRLKPANAS